MSFNLHEAIVQDIVHIGKKYNLKKIVLFGSRARGDNKEKSDIDLAIYFHDNNTNKSQVYFDLEDINTLLKLDISFIDNNTDKKLVENIERDGVVLYEGR